MDEPKGMMHFYWKSILAYFDANVSCLTQEKQVKLLKGAFKTKQKQTKNAFFMYWCELWSWLFSRDFFLRSASVSWLLRRNSCFTAKFFQVCHFSHTPFYVSWKAYILEKKFIPIEVWLLRHDYAYCLKVIKNIMIM